MFHYANRTALITGASGGIGEAFARNLAARGMNLVLVARTEAKLNALAEELQATHQIQATVIPLDLSDPNAVRQIETILAERHLAIDLLVNSAGFGTSGPFATIDPTREREEILVNVLAIVDLCHLLVPAMIARGSGGIINLSSNTAFQPVPYMAVYAATKSFVLSFSEALHVELKDTGVHVLGLCPGPTNTEFFTNANARRVGQMVGKTMRSPEAVVETALKALESNTSSVVDGLLYGTAARLGRLVPISLQTRAIGRALRPSTNN